MEQKNDKNIGVILIYEDEEDIFASLEDAMEKAFHLFVPTCKKYSGKKRIICWQGLLLDRACQEALSGYTIIEQIAAPTESQVHELYYFTKHVMINRLLFFLIMSPALVIMHHIYIQARFFEHLFIAS